MDEAQVPRVIKISTPSLESNPGEPGMFRNLYTED